MATLNLQLGIVGNVLCMGDFFVVKTFNQNRADMDEFACENGVGQFNRSGGTIGGEGFTRYYIFDDEKTAIMFKLCFG